MTRLAYDTDLSADQWALIAPSLPAAKAGGRPRTLDLREVLNAIFYLLSNGIKWRAMPAILILGNSCSSFRNVGIVRTSEQLKRARIIECARIV